MPDILFTSCFTVPCFIELKKEGKEVKGGQSSKLAKLNKAGCKAFAVIGYNGYLKLKVYLNINIINLKKAHNRLNDENDFAEKVKNEFNFK